VILVDNGSTDGTPSLARRHFPQIDVVALGRNRGAVARNIGVEKAVTPYVAFADDDSWWAPGALATAEGVMDRHPRLAVLAGRVLVGPEEQPDAICDLMAQAPLGREEDLPGPSILGFLACGVVVRRDAFLAAGGFDEVIFFMGEEERLALDLAALGWGLAYVDRVVAHHEPSPSRDTTSRQARVARNQLLTAVLRRPWRIVVTVAGQQLAAGATGRRGVLQALAVLPKALPRRRLLPSHVEERRRRLERLQNPPQVSRWHHDAVRVSRRISRRTPHPTRHQRRERKSS
jgi:GT2 family glycosyltransferase